MSGKDREVEILQKALKAMIRSRAFEEKTIELYQKGIIQGSLHPGIGHEAAGAGVAAGLRDDDYIFPHHRGLGAIMYRGSEPKYIMAEWFGRSTGIAGGKGGVTHLADAKRHILGVSGIVGANLPIAMGVALSLKMKHSDRVVACGIGDGAINQGSFHESANQASLWKLPLIYVCENNFYAFSVPLEASSAVSDLEKRASAYGMPGIVVDGMDVQAVRESVAEAAVRARAGDGPTFLNCKLYRYYGHSMSDARKYRTRQEEEKWQERDPIRIAANTLAEQGATDQVELSALEEEVRREVDAAVQFAQDSPVPREEDLYVNVYSQ